MYEIEEIAVVRSQQARLLALTSVGLTVPASAHEKSEPRAPRGTAHCYWHSRRIGDQRGPEASCRARPDPTTIRPWRPFAPRVGRGARSRAPTGGKHL